MSSESIKVILVDDHQIFRDGVLSMFEGNLDISVIGLASDGEEAIKLSKELDPDVVMIDISMPGISGLEAIKEILKHNPDIGVLVLSMHTEEVYIAEALGSGARGYLPKQDTTKSELETAIKKIYSNEEYFGKSVEKIMQKRFLNDAKGESISDLKSNLSNLTKREKEILRLVMEGMSNQEIADRLFVHIRTIETHKTNIMSKLQLKNTVELVKYAIKSKFFEI